MCLKVVKGKRPDVPFWICHGLSPLLKWERVYPVYFTANQQNIKHSIRKIYGRLRMGH